MINEERDPSLITHDSCPISYRPYSVSIVKSSLPKLIYTDFELKNNSVIFKGRGLIDTGSTVCLISKELLSTSVTQSLKATGSTITGVGGDTKVIGTIVGNVNIGGAEFENVRFDVVNRITSEVKCILGLNIFSHPSVHNLNLDNKNQVITFILNPYPVFFGTITESDLWKKNPRSSLVTSQLGLRQ